jgi:iron complex transport system substrate-binding protein
MIRGATLAVLLAVAGCAPGEPARAPEPAGSPARIVSMAPALTEILFALGLGERVVGVTRYCDYPPEARDRATIGGFVNPSVEEILSLRPDLVVVSPAAGNRDAALAVRQAGVPLEVIPAETLADAYVAMTRVAEVCGVPDRGVELERTVRERIGRVSAAVADRPRVPVLLCLQVDPLIAAGRGTLPAQLVELAGGVNVVEVDRYPRIGIETVIARAPAVILQARMDLPSPAANEDLLAFWSRWPSIPAVRDRRVLVFDGAPALRAGPRVADAVEFLAACLHPGTVDAEAGGPR